MSRRQRQTKLQPLHSIQIRINFRLAERPQSEHEYSCQDQKYLNLCLYLLREGICGANVECGDGKKRVENGLENIYCT